MRIQYFPGFLIVAACIMIFESRDSAAKIAPVSATMHGPGTENNTQGGPIKVNNKKRKSCFFLYLYLLTKI